MEPFRVGVNYWPARTAMGWWAQFDRAVVAADFARIAGSGLDSVRVFLTWEDFQPAPDEVDRVMVERLVTVADLARESGLSIVPTLFTGHMSGVNWLPAWALGGSEGDTRFSHERRQLGSSPQRRPAPSPATRRSGRGTSATRTPTA
jgi:endo-1,4-beta-mannosidase